MMLGIGFMLGIAFMLWAYPFYLRKLSKVQTRIRQIQHGQIRTKRRA